MTVTDNQFRVLLDLCWASNPWPLSWGRGEFFEFLDKVSYDHGYENWVTAYHEFSSPGIAKHNEDDMPFSTYPPAECDK